MRVFLRLIRVKHWIKNVLVLFPYIFSGSLFGSGGGLAFLSFSLTASAVYVVNDIRDVKADRAHPTKCSRPLASGDVSIPFALAIAVVFLLLSVLLTALLSDRPILALTVLFSYFAINIAYSFGLKSIPVVDVFIVAIGFLLRVLFGGAFGGIVVSPWLFLTVVTLSFYLALGKRRGELREVGAQSRVSLERYTYSFLDSNMQMFLACGLVFYSLWAMAQSSAHVSVAVFFFASILLVMLICMRYSFLIESGSSDGDPVTVVMSDRGLLALGLLWVVCMLVPLYGVA